VCVRARARACMYSPPALAHLLASICMSVMRVCVRVLVCVCVCTYSPPALANWPAPHSLHSSVFVT